MRKLLLSLFVLLIALCAKAEKFTWTDANDNTLSVTADDNGPGTPQSIAVSTPGALAAFVNATKDNTGGLGNEPLNNIGHEENRKDLVITGSLNAYDFAALSSAVASGWSTFTSIDLSGATFNTADMSDMAMSNLEYIILPNGAYGKGMADEIATLNSNNPSLKMAASVTNSTEMLPTWTGEGSSRTRTVTPLGDVKRLALYSWQENSVADFLTKYGDMADNIDKLDMAGVYGEYDLTNNASIIPENRLFTSDKLHYFDFTGATFKDNVTVNYVTKEAYNGTWDGNSGQLQEGGHITIENSNALYFLRAYVEDVYTCNLPTGNTEIPPGLFTADNTDILSLLQINIPNGYTRIGESAFYGAPLQQVTIPSTITNVAEGAFRECRQLTNVEMEASETSCTFGAAAFMFCTNLQHFTMGEGTTNISDQMFEQCWKLESIRIPGSCRYIGNHAFFLNTSLHEITIPVGMERIEHQAFYQSGLTDIYLLATNPSDLPAIYAVTNFDYDRNSSFTRKDIIGENTPALQRDDLACTTIATSTSDQVPAYYQEALSNGGYLGSSRCLVSLHFPDELCPFINGVVVDGAPSLSQFTRLDGKTSITEEYMFTDSEGEKWPSQDSPQQETSDYRVRFAAGNVTGQTIYGWRQFALSHGTATSENFSRLYDDTWYTICFPWNVNETQLFGAFNEKCELVEFKGAEVIEGDEDYSYSLVLHFDELAQASYMDPEGSKYNRYDDGTYTITDPATITYNKYRYVKLDDNGDETSDVVVFTPNAQLGSTVNNRYYQIEKVMVKAGHPYMIHPASVEQQGRASLCTISGVKRKAKTDTELENMENDNKVTLWATSGDAQTVFNGPLGSGQYTFHGYLGRGAYDNEKNPIASYNQDNDKSDIPQKSYFLGKKTGEKYPKFYRKMASGTDKWTIYTAIITPEENALNHIEALDGGKVSSSANVMFGEWEQVEADAIEEIITEAEEKGQDVRRVNLNVVYNINGQVVRTDGQIEGLPHGLYIVNGKKYMVK